METADITLIRTIAEQGSLTRAAEMLHTSQPTLSKRLARLESQLRTQLFFRSPTGLVPTEVATYIVDSSQPIQAQLRRIERHVEQLTDLESGEVRLGIGPIIEQVLLPGVVEKFMAATGNVHLFVHTDHADTLLAGLHNADLDVIAGPFRAAEHNNLVGYPLIKDNLVAVVRAGHPLLAAGAGEGIGCYPLASPGPQGSGAGGAAGRWTARKQVASENYPLLKHLTVNSDCVCRGPWYLFRDELQKGALVEVDDQEPVPWESACLVRPESVESPLVKLLVELLIEASTTYVRR